MKNQTGQHYLPQFYLRAWSTGSDQVNVYDLNDKKWFKTSTKNICQERGFYDVPMLDGSPVSIDPDVQKIESRASASLAKLRQDKSLAALSPDEREHIATFCSLIVLGVPAFRETLAELIEPLIITGRPRLSDIELKALAVDTLANQLDQNTKIYLQMRWVLCDSPTGAVFHTSDNPLVQYKPQKSVKTYYDQGLGLLSPGISLQLPISPDLLLMMFYSDDYPWMKDERMPYYSASLPHLTGLLVWNCSRLLIARDASIPTLMSGMLRAPARVQMTGPRPSTNAQPKRATQDDVDGAGHKAR